MYAFLDRPINDLSDGSIFVLCAMRGWTNALAERKCPPAALAATFARLRVMSAMPDFGRVMMLLNRDGLGQLALAPIAAQRISEDEAVLLSVWSDLVADENERACATLALLIDKDAIEPLLAAMVDTAASLSVVGLAPAGLKTRATDRTAGSAK